MTDEDALQHLATIACSRLLPFRLFSPQERSALVIALRAVADEIEDLDIKENPADQGGALR